MEDKLINIFNNNGILTVTSREIARNFDKRHDKLTSEIERMYGNYICDEEGYALNGGGSSETEKRKYTLNGGTPFFIKTTYVHEQNNQRYKQYLLTRDGLSLLVMGFTGQKALEWKLKYIEAFNKMENYIKSMDNNPTNQLTDKQRLQLEFLNCSSDEAVLLHKQLIEIAKNEAIIEERNGNDKITNLSNIVAQLGVNGLTTTLFNEWLCEQGFGEMVTYVGNKKRRVFTPNDKFFEVLVSQGYMMTGKTASGKKRIIYTTRMLDYSKENIELINEFVNTRNK